MAIDEEIRQFSAGETRGVDSEFKSGRASKRKHGENKKKELKKNHKFGHPGCRRIRKTIKKKNTTQPARNKSTGTT